MKEESLKIEEIISMKTGLDLVLESQDLPMKTRYWFGRLADSVESVSKSVQKQEEALIKTKYGEEDKESGQWKVPADKLMAFQNDKAALLKENDIIKVPDFKLSELIDSTPFKTLILLRHIIKNDLKVKVSEKKGTYTIQELINISMALTYFFQKSVKSDEGKDKAEPVQISDKKLVYKLLSLKNAVAPVVEGYNKDIEQLNMEMTTFNKAGQQVPLEGKTKEYQEKTDELMNAKHKLNIPVLKFEDIESQEYLPGNFFKLASSFLED